MEDRWNLKRFKEAQEGVYCTALSEIRRGRKESHWMWFIFPQLRGLGRSAAAEYYGLSGLEEARAYLEDEVLGARLLEGTRALLEQPCRDAEKVMGWPDNLKLCSCMTLFHAVCPQEGCFAQVLREFFEGQEDGRTLSMLKESGETPKRL